MSEGGGGELLVPLAGSGSGGGHSVSIVDEIIWGFEGVKWW